jgi:hypothetical protein
VRVSLLALIMIAMYTQCDDSRCTTQPVCVSRLRLHSAHVDWHVSLAIARFSLSTQVGDQLSAWSASRQESAIDRLKCWGAQDLRLRLSLSLSLSLNCRLES